MVDEFFLKSLIQITHGEIRLIDKELYNVFYYAKGAVSCPLYPAYKNAFNTQSSE